MFCYSLKYVTQRFNLSHVTEVSAQIFKRAHKRSMQLGKPYINFLIYYRNRIYFTLILNMKLIKHCLQPSIIVYFNQIYR